MKYSFEGDLIEVVLEGKRVLFNTDEVAYAAGFARTASLDRHIKGTKYDVLGKTGKRYLTADGIRYAAELANKTPRLKAVAKWALQIKKAELDRLKPTKVVPALVKEAVKAVVNNEPRLSSPNYGLKESATKLGMNVRELSDWLVDEGYAGRYASNNNLYWKQYFKDQRYGTCPVIKDEKGYRVSNVARLTEAGITFVKNRLASKSQAGVLAFAKKEASEAEKLEAELDALIKDTFIDTRTKSGHMALIFEDEQEYVVSESILIKRIKSIIAQVKLKEKK